MPDYEIFAPNDATMQQALQALGMRFNSGRVSNAVFAVDYYGTKYLNTSGTMVPQSGVYANVRWMGASALGLPTSVTSQGATMKLLSAPYYIRFLG